LPDYLARHLRDVHHYTVEQVAATTVGAAQTLLNAYYAQYMAKPEDDSGTS